MVAHCVHHIFLSHANAWDFSIQKMEHKSQKKDYFMSLSNKQMSSILYTIADATSRMIDALDNDGKLKTADARAIRNTMLKNICDVELDDFIQQRRANHKLLMKRGSSTDNNEYIGKNGEITVDMDEKTLRVHDGQTAGGPTLARVSDIPEIASADYVVAWQNPTAENNYTWYRKYKSGWVEQGGLFTPKGTSTGGGTIATIALPIEMSDDKYWWSAKITGSASSGAYLGVTRNSTTSGTSLVLKGWCIVAQEASWHVVGFAAA